MSNSKSASQELTVTLQLFSFSSSVGDSESYLVCLKNRKDQVYSSGSASSRRKARRLGKVFLRDAKLGIYHR